MTYVATESCIKCKYTHRCEVCPTDAFRDGPNFFAIDLNECIDCTLCVIECPVKAIFADEDLPLEQTHFIPLNVELAKIWKTITARKDALPDADQWA